MKNTGMKRKVDELGRIVIPIELRNELGINVKDPLEILVEDNLIILRKSKMKCIFCGNLKKIKEYNNKPICEKCFLELRKNFIN